jgi:hypothetical protein
MSSAGTQSCAFSRSSRLAPRSWPQRRGRWRQSKAKTTATQNLLASGSGAGPTGSVERSHTATLCFGSVQRLKQQAKGFVRVIEELSMASEEYTQSTAHKARSIPIPLVPAEDHEAVNSRQINVRRMPVCASH